MKKLGRLPRKYDYRIPMAHNLLAQKSAGLPPAPLAVDYSASLPDDLGMFLNDKLGDCTCAAYFHALQIWTGYEDAKAMVTVPDNTVEALYEQACGYDPKNPNSDQGGIEQDVLAYLLQKDTISGYIEVDPKNLDVLKRAIADCGIAYIGVDLPQSVLDNADDITVQWDARENDSIAGGHAVILVGYDLDTFTAISWGKRYKITHSFLAVYLMEAYGIISQKWIRSTGKSPFGMTLAELENAMKKLRE